MQSVTTNDVEAYAEFYRSPAGMLVKKLQPAIGAEISEIDLSKPIAADVARDIKSILLAHGVIFFRDQRLDHETHHAVASLFGPLIKDGPDPQRPAIIPIKGDGGAKDQSANKWHSDAVYQSSPPSVSVLRSINVPRLGGDTCFSSAVAAYEGLSAEMKERIASLRYSTDIAYATRRAVLSTRERYDNLRLKYPPCDHPVVRIHPETGAKTLFVNEAYSMSILGLDEREGSELIRELCDEFRKPEYQVRWKWTPDALAIWDNQAVQHYAVANQATDRYLERISVEGTPTLSIVAWEALNNGKIGVHA
jgi:alpha-ketoglutarate-dependent taurine dioxygenase